MKQQFNHKALKLQDKKQIVFTAFSKKFFYMRMFIVKFVLEQGKVPLNPFMSFDYYLLDTVDRDIIRNANNNMVSLASELWVFGPISDGVMAEIKQTREQGKIVKYFKIVNDKKIIEINKNELVFEDGLEKFRNEL